MATRVEALAPPEERLTLLRWLQHNLFDGLWNAILTVTTSVVLVAAGVGIARWVAISDWSVVTDNLRFWLVGLMPVEYVGRALWAGGLIAITAVLTAVGVRAHVRPQTIAAAWGGIFVAVLWIMSPLRLDQIGGLYLTLLLAVVAISFSFPIGVIVGVGRVSALPVIRALSTVYIEADRKSVV